MTLLLSICSTEINCSQNLTPTQEKLVKATEDKKRKEPPSSDTEERVSKKQRTLEENKDDENVTVTLAGADQSITISKQVANHSALFEGVFTNDTSFEIPNTRPNYQELKKLTLAELEKLLKIMAQKENDEAKRNTEIDAWMAKKDIYELCLIEDYLIIPALYKRILARYETLSAIKADWDQLKKLPDHNLNPIIQRIFPIKIFNKVRYLSEKKDTYEEDYVKAIAWSPDGKSLAMAMKTFKYVGNSSESECKEIRSSIQILNIINFTVTKIIKTADIKNLTWPDKNTIVAGTKNNTELYSYNVLSGNEIKLWYEKTTPTKSKMNEFEFKPLVASHDGSLIIFARTDGTVSILDLKQQKITKKLKTTNGEDVIQNLAINPNGTLASLDDERNICVQNIKTEQKECTSEYSVKKYGGYGYGEIAWSPDGTTLAFSAHKNLAIFDDPKTLTSYSRLFKTDGWIKAIAWSPDGKRINMIIAEFLAPNNSPIISISLQEINAQKGERTQKINMFIKHGRDWFSGFDCLAWSPHNNYLAALVNNTATIFVKPNSRDQLEELFKLDVFTQHEEKKTDEKTKIETRGEPKKSSSGQKPGVCKEITSSCVIQ